MTGDILVVDDVPLNLVAMIATLAQLGHRVRPVTSGAAALEAARAQRPDLVLLDIRMPGMDGYEVCRALKNDPALCDIPVIFLSANSETSDKVDAFAVGGVDYVTKPFSVAEIEARISVHLAIRAHERALREAAARQLALEQLRDALVHMLVHDLRSPLAATMSLVEMVREEPGNVLTEASLHDLADVIDATARMSRMITAVLDVNRLEAAKLELKRSTWDAHGLVEEVAGMYRGATRKTVAIDVNGGPAPLVADREQMSRVLQNLLDNAIRFSEGVVRIEVAARDDGVTIRVIDNGAGISEVARASIFDKYVTGSKRGGRASSGLGLTYCKLAVEAHGGRIDVASELGRGTTFTVWLPHGIDPGEDH